MKALTTLGAYPFFVFLSFISFDTKSQTQQICSNDVPVGWITVSFNGACSANMLLRTITRYDNLPLNSELTFCSDAAVPEGWITTKIGNYCNPTDSTSFLSRTIRRIDCLPVRSIIEVCDIDPIPEGWDILEVSGFCYYNPPVISLRKVIRKVRGIPHYPFISGPTKRDICLGTSVTLSDSNCLNGTVTWSNGSIGPSITVTPDTTTSYTATCTQGQCTSPNSSPVTINVTSPEIQIPLEATTCAGTAATLTATGCVGTYKWYGSNTSTIILASNATYITPPLNNNTNYYASCTINLCESSRKAILVQIDALPDAPMISTTNNFICSGQSTALTATGCNGTVSWSNGLSGSSISVDSVGTYTATCQNDHCISLESNKLIISYGAPDTLMLTGIASNEVKSAIQTITSTQIILNNVNTTYNAGDAILLLPPFSADFGSIFKVEIKGCSD